jgi:hypothetical protein
MRIILSSLLYHSLDQMGSFTHHNTSINILDAIVHPDTPRQQVPQSPSSLASPSAALEAVTVKTDNIYHPPSIEFKAVLLDGRDHLPMELQQ